MDSSIQLYSYDEAPVRVVMLGDPPAPWFVAKDVCDILGYANARDALARHLDDDEKADVAIHDGSQRRNMNVINESGLYCLILRSNMPKAREFRKWVTSTVLPQVMRNGLPETSKGQLTETIMYATKMILEAAHIENNQLDLALDKVASHYIGHSLLGLAGVALIAPNKRQLLTPTQIGAHFGVSGRKINELLVREEYQRKEATGYEPLPLGDPYAVMQDTGRKHSDGTPIRQLKWESSIVDELSGFFPTLSL